jgi:hypothetical protein
MTEQLRLGIAGVSALCRRRRPYVIVSTPFPFVPFVSKKDTNGISDAPRTAHPRHVHRKAA